MKMQQRQFRIGQLAKEVGVERFVIRFWEKEFGLRPTRSQGGQRFYRAIDLEKFQLIKHLLHNKGFTIAGAKKFLHEKQPHEAFHAATQTAPMANETTNDVSVETIKELDTTLKEQLIGFKEQLLRLYEIL